MEKGIRLIDANLLVEFVGTRTSVWIYKPDLFWAIEQQPTVDAVEVVHGVWEEAGKNIYGQHLTRCSVCKANSIEGGFYCRCCGAMMH